MLSRAVNVIVTKLESNNVDANCLVRLVIHIFFVDFRLLLYNCITVYTELKMFFGFFLFSLTCTICRASCV